jgi:hypothetical protein
MGVCGIFNNKKQIRLEILTLGILRISRHVTLCGHQSPAWSGSGFWPEFF